MGYGIKTRVEHWSEPTLEEAEDPNPAFEAKSVEGIGKYNDGDLRVYDIFIMDKRMTTEISDNSAIKG